MLVSGSALARELGVNPSSITRAQRSGRIEYEAGTRKFDLAKSVARWHSMRERNPSPLRARSAQGREANAGVAGTPLIGGEGRLFLVRLSREAALAELTRIDLRVRQGSLLDADDVAHAMAEALIVLRQGFELIGERIGAAVASALGVNDAPAIAMAGKLIDGEIATAMRNVARMNAVVKPWDKSRVEAEVRAEREGAAENR